MKSFGEQFLHKKDSKLHTSKAVELEMERKKIRGEEVSQKPAEKISDWLEVIERTHTGHREDPEVMERIKNYYHKEYVIKSEDIPESAYLLEQRIAREAGHGTIEITDEFRKRKQEQIINDQTHSLDKWLDYLTSEDAKYPTWAKYWAFKCIVTMGKLEKGEDENGQETARFAPRTKDTTASFPALNSAALSMTIGALRSKLEEDQKSKDERQPIENISKKLKDEEFQKLLTTENFSKLYKQFLLEQPMYSTEGLKEIRGKWITYSQGSKPEQLVKSLEGYPLEWCIRDIGTARDYLQGGDMYVYYSVNEAGEAKIPRLAIRMQEDSIAEVRGIAHDQNLDPYIAPVVETKMKEFPDGEKYEKKSADMKKLTEIENKTQKKQQLTKEELTFLYEINSKIEGFGYNRDPRIKELLDQRDPKQDAPVVFDCKPDQIAYTEKEINENTKAYIGVWNPIILKNLPKNIEHIYSKFPDQKVFLKEIIPDKEINSAKTAIKKLEAEGHQVGDYAKDMLTKVNWEEKLKNSYEIVSFSVGELFGDTKVHAYAEIKAKALKEGLDLVPANLAPSIRLNYEKSGQWTVMVMEAIRDRADNPPLFNCYSDGSLSWLSLSYGRDDNEWYDSYRFFFARK